MANRLVLLNVNPDCSTDYVLGVFDNVKQLRDAVKDQKLEARSSDLIVRQVESNKLAKFGHDTNGTTLELFLASKK
jgi:hypothetical protein